MRSIPDDNLRYPVLVTLAGGLTASGFYLNNDEKDVYFVTAKHVLFKKSINTDNLSLNTNNANLLSYPSSMSVTDPIELELQLDFLMEAKRIIVDPVKDIAAIKVAEQDEKLERRTIGGVKVKSFPQGSFLLTVARNIIKKFDEILISNEVFIFGYPTSLGIHDYPQIEYKKPLLRKGVIAGKNDSKRTIILDCPVYYGNSGGPVLEVEEINVLKTKLYIIGVVSEFVPFENKWYNIKHGYTNTEIENSGYSVVTPMDSVLELIDKSCTISK